MSIVPETGGNKDYIIVGTDSGRISIMEYVAAKNTFEKVSLQSFIHHFYVFLTLNVRDHPLFL